mgnify:CR=1 FL=1
MVVILTVLAGIVVPRAHSFHAWTKAASQALVIETGAPRRIRAERMPPPLIRALGVLGRHEQAALIWREAQSVFTDPAALEPVRAAARDFARLADAAAADDAARLRYWQALADRKSVV